MDQEKWTNIRIQVGEMRHGVEVNHLSVNQQAKLLRALLGPDSKPVRRADEAGAALQRLEWALQRLDPQREPSVRSASAGN